MDPLSDMLTMLTVGHVVQVGLESKGPYAMRFSGFIVADALVIGSLPFCRPRDAYAAAGTFDLASLSQCSGKLITSSASGE